MRSRDLNTTPIVVVSDYTITPSPSGDYLHAFLPNSTEAQYRFISGPDPVLEEGQAYNVGFISADGVNWVDISSITPASAVIPALSHKEARRQGEKNRLIETQKSNDRVKHTATDGPYLGRKYAWRIYGMALSQETFADYLAEIAHPSVPCVISCTGHRRPSTAYRDIGLEKALDALIASCVRIGSNRFTSPLLPSRMWFTVKGVTAITDKK